MQKNEIFQKTNKENRKRVREAKKQNGIFQKTNKENRKRVREAKKQNGIFQKTNKENRKRVREEGNTVEKGKRLENKAGERGSAIWHGTKGDV